MIVVVSSYCGYPDDPDEQFGVENWNKGIRERFQKSAQAPLNTVVLDVKTKNPAKFKENADKLWKLVSAMQSFECKEMKAVMADLDEKNAMIKDLMDELARVKTLAGIKVIFVAITHFMFNPPPLPGPCDSAHGCSSYHFRKVSKWFSRSNLFKCCFLHKYCML